MNYEVTMKRLRCFECGKKIPPEKSLSGCRKGKFIYTREMCYDCISAYVFGLFQYFAGRGEGQDFPVSYSIPETESYAFHICVEFIDILGLETFLLELIQHIEDRNQENLLGVKP